MTGTRIPIIAWTLLLIAALAIGTLALYLLQGEQQRLEATGIETRRERLAAVAGTVDLTVTESREALSTRLRELPGPDLIDTLELWRLDNPLIRNVFVWSPDQGLVFPEPTQPTSGEESAFLLRYAGLFSGQARWTVFSEEITPASDQIQARRELTKLAKSLPTSASAPAESAGATSDIRDNGWLPWFWEEGLHLLLWAERSDGRRFGIELEMAALLARLVTVLPQPQSPHETWALLNDRGEVVHQRGPEDLSTGQKPTMSVAVGNSLPHWQIGFYSTGEAKPAGQSLLLLGGLLTAILVIAIMLGGSLLLWQARRSLHDARRKTTFVSNVSHELKTPLTTIRMYAEMLEEDERRCDKSQRYLAVISSEAQRLTRLVNNLLDFSRLEQGKKKYHQQQVDLRALISQCLTTQNLRLHEAGLALDLQLPTTHLSIETDSDALEQVLLNLIDNAVKYAASGDELQLTLIQDNGQVMIQVADRGPGIPNSHSQRIFEIFHRVDSSLTTDQQGCGLGLSIARQLVRDLGGELTYAARDGGGACFTISLPKSRPKEGDN